MDPKQFKVNGYTDIRLPKGSVAMMPVMPAVSEIHVAPVTPALVPAVDALQVAPGQLPYVGETAFNRQQAQDDPMSEAMAVLSDDAVIGFYRLDFAPNAVVGHGFDMPSVGVRALMLDRARQGRGDGRRAVLALCDDLRRRHPRRRLLVLTVNCRNRAALAAYRKAGCVETGKLYAGGRAGPLHVMLRFLRDTLHDGMLHDGTPHDGTLYDSRSAQAVGE